MSIGAMVIRDEQLEEVATLLEALAVALRLLKIGATQQPNPPAPPPEPVPAPAPPRPGVGIVIGSRVQIGKTLDIYRNRRGVVTGRRGDHYWYLTLDLVRNETVAPKIYKKGTSLTLLP